MMTRPQDAERRYLDLLKRSVLNELYLEDEARIIYMRRCLSGLDRYERSVEHEIRSARRQLCDDLVTARQVGKFVGHDIDTAAYNHTMIGRLRLDSLHECLDIVRQENVQGDVIECGVWRGGSCIFMAGYLGIHDMSQRRVFVADSFQGLPKPSLEQDQGLDLNKEIFPQLAVDRETVELTFSRYDLLADNVVFLEGWFKDTLPRAPIERLALLRLDGDLYESTMDVLSALYHKVEPGGVVIIDDFMLPHCRAAFGDYFRMQGLEQPTLSRVDHTGVWFRKDIK